MINTENISFEIFDNNNIKHVSARNELLTNSSSEFIHHIDERLIGSKEDK